MICNCGLLKCYSACCGSYHQKPSLVQSAEALMRSRYCAYVMHNADYIYETTLPEVRMGIDKTDILNWAKQNKWMGLEIIEATERTVEFKAHYLDHQLKPQVHHECSIFKKVDEQWYYVSGKYVE